MRGDRSAITATLIISGMLGTAACSSDRETGREGNPAGGSSAIGGSAAVGGSSGKGAPTTKAETFEPPHEGQYHLGPVDFAESEWHNACAPAGGYRAELRESVGLGGEYLAGVARERSQAGGVCDACIAIETEKGKSIVARVVTYGDSQAAGDIDVSPSVFEALHEGEFPRSMTWRFARCPDVGGLAYEFQTEANHYWTSLWVRNPRVPLTKAEVKSASDGDFVELARTPDGALTDASGFGDGAFTLRLTGLDGQVVTEELAGFEPGQLFKSKEQFE